MDFTNQPVDLGAFLCTHQATEQFRDLLSSERCHIISLNCCRLGFAVCQRQTIATGATAQQSVLLPKISEKVRTACQYQARGTDLPIHSTLRGFLLLNLRRYQFLKLPVQLGSEFPAYFIAHLIKAVKNNNARLRTNEFYDLFSTHRTAGIRVQGTVDQFPEFHL